MMLSDGCDVEVLVVTDSCWNSERQVVVKDNK